MVTTAKRWMRAGLGCVVLLAVAEPALAKNPTETIRFAAGTSSATRTGTVKGYTGRDYVLTASAGQTMTVKVTSKSTFVYFNVLDKATGEALDAEPPPREVTEWTGVLPKAGDYVVSVYLVRAEARRNRAAPYTLTVSVANTASSQSPATGDALGSTDWVLESIKRGETEVAIPSGVAIRARFDAGRVAGRAVCNRYFASYTLAGERLTIGNVGATRMFCGEHADLESAYFEVLAGEHTIAVHDGRLEVSGTTGTLMFAR